MSSDSYYKWRSQCAGMDASHMKQLRKITSENARLKKLYAEALLHADIIKEALAKN
jgi:putative transposase